MADIALPMRTTAAILARLLARTDAGWFYVLAGAVLAGACILIPARADLAVLQDQLDHLRAQERLLAGRLEAHADFIDELDRGNPALVRRLAATQLNLVAAGERPRILTAERTASIGAWLDTTLSPEIIAAASEARELEPDGRRSLLSRLTEGSSRLWLIGASGLCVFIGLLLGPAVPGERRTRDRPRLPAGRVRHPSIDVETETAAPARWSVPACVPCEHAVSPAKPVAESTTDPVTDAAPELSTDPTVLDVNDVAAAGQPLDAPRPLALQLSVYRTERPSVESAPDAAIVAGNPEDEVDVFDEDDIAGVPISEPTEPLEPLEPTEPTEPTEPSEHGEQSMMAQDESTRAAIQEPDVDLDVEPEVDVDVEPEVDVDVEPDVDVDIDAEADVDDEEYEYVYVDEDGNEVDPDDPDVDVVGIAEDDDEFDDDEYDDEEEDEDDEDEEEDDDFDYGDDEDDEYEDEDEDEDDDFADEDEDEDDDFADEDEDEDEDDEEFGDEEEEDEEPVADIGDDEDEDEEYEYEYEYVDGDEDDEDEED